MYIPEEGKKIMKKIEVWSSTNPGGRKTKNVVQKHRVKALDGDWNALKQKLRLCPPRSLLLLSSSSSSGTTFSDL